MFDFQDRNPTTAPHPQDRVAVVAERPRLRYELQAMPEMSAPETRHRPHLSVPMPVVLRDPRSSRTNWTTVANRKARRRQLALAPDDLA